MGYFVVFTYFKMSKSSRNKQVGSCLISTGKAWGTSGNANTLECNEFKEGAMRANINYFISDI
jgi:hypothetical protein